MKVAETSCSSSCLEGEYLAAPAGACTAMLRYAIKVSEPTTLSASLAISGEDMRACSRLVLVDNATGAETLVLLARLPATELQPTPEGYTLVAVSEVPTGTQLPTRPGGHAAPAIASGTSATGGGVAEDGTWALSVTSSKPATLEPISKERVQVFRPASKNLGFRVTV